MKKSVMQKWVEALRSKKYKQGRKFLKGKLKDGTMRHCCLGVLCELYQKDQRAKGKKTICTKQIKKFDEIDNFVCAMPSTTRRIKSLTLFQDGKRSPGLLGFCGAVLPGPVMRWAGLASDTGEYQTRDVEEHFCLAEMNDDGVSFTKIADTIEQHYKNL